MADEADFARLSRQIADLAARMERAGAAKPRRRKRRRHGKRVACAPPDPPGPEPSDLDVARALRILRENGWHE